MELNLVEVKNTFSENAYGYTVYEVWVDGTVFFAGRSNLGTWKFCDTHEITPKTRNIPVWIDRRNCGLQLASLMERMLLAKTDRWEGPLPRILAK